jgi:hypothetical protein
MLTRRQHVRALMMACLIGGCASATLPRTVVEPETRPQAAELEHEIFRAVVAFELPTMGEILTVDPVPIQWVLDGSMPDMDDRVALHASELQKRVDTLEHFGVRIGNAVPLRAACTGLMVPREGRQLDGCPSSQEVAMILVGMPVARDRSWQQGAVLVEYNPRGRTISEVLYVLEVEDEKMVVVETIIESVIH